MVYKAYDGGTNYIDLTKGLTLHNGKQYNQFKGDKPLGYMVTARLVNPRSEIKTAPTSWAVRNGLVKTAASWRRMLKKAGVRKKDLNTYGKELRMTLTEDHSDTYGRNGDLVPHDILASANLVEYDTGTKNDDGLDVYVTAYTKETGAGYGQGSGIFAAQYREHAFDRTILTVPNPSGNAAEEISWTPHVISASGDSAISTTRAYITSRRNEADVEDTDFETEIASPDNYLTLMLSDNEESADNVIEDVSDVGDFRPYSLEYQNSLVTQVLSEANVPGQDSTFIAPLGLIEWTAVSQDEELILTVEAITEM